MDLSNKEDDENEQETSEMQFEGFALLTNASDFASRSKAKAKTTKTYFCLFIFKNVPVGERSWTDIEPQEYSLSDCSMSEKLINLLRHGSLPQKR